jgi:hypothetical protein
MLEIEGSGLGFWGSGLGILGLEIGVSVRVEVRVMIHGLVFRV